MDISFISAGIKPSYTPPAPSADKAPAIPAQTVQVEDISLPMVQADDTTADADAARLAALEHAAQTIAADAYPVSDVKFTIFKDASGQYITRFTNLRDGQVTYFPEQNVFTYLGKRGGGNNLINIKV